MRWGRTARSAPPSPCRTSPWSTRKKRPRRWVGRRPGCPVRLSVGVGLSARLFAQPASGGSGVELTLCTSTGQRLCPAINREHSTRVPSVVRNGGVGTGSCLVGGSGCQAASSEGSASDSTVLSTEPCGGLSGPFVF